MGLLHDPDYTGGGETVEQAMRRIDSALVRTQDDTATIRAIRRVAGVIGDATLGSRCIAHLPALELA